MKTNRRNQSGSVLVLVALTMSMSFVLMAMVLDMGLIVASKNELQNAADSASLAAASQLMDEDLLTGSGDQSDDLIDARDFAQAFASHNVAGRRYLAVGRNDGNDVSGDVVVGYIDDPFNLSESIQTSGVPKYNSVEVKTQLSAAINGPLSLFLGAFTGSQVINVYSRSTATLEDRIGGFELGPGQTLPMMPFAAYADAWEDAIDYRNGPDNYRVVNGNVQWGGDGIPELHLYPYRNGYGPSGTRGNVGTIFISVVVGTSYVNNQIYAGMTVDDLNTVGGVRLADNGGDELSQWLPGENWVSSSWFNSLRNIRGKTRIMPLYIAVNASNPTAYADPGLFDEPMSDRPDVETCCAITQYYKSVEYKAVTVIDACWPSNNWNKHFVVQPTVMNSEHAIVDVDAPSSGLIYTLSLTR